MKLASVLAIATAALISFDHTLAASTCTEDELNTILSLGSELLSDEKCVEATQKAPNTKCPVPECMPAAEKVAANMPDCIFDGMNAKETSAKKLKECKDSSAVSRSFSTSAGVALSSVVLTVAMLHL